MAAGTGTVVAIALLCDLPGGQVAWIGASAAVASALWTLLEPRRHGHVVPLAGMLLVLAAAVAISGVPADPAGPMRDWYEGLGVARAEEVPVVQALLAVAVAVYLLSTGNRIVRLVLGLAGTIRVEDSALKGGRLLGPMERLFVVAMILAGEPGAIAIIVAGKGLIRFREIKGTAHRQTEYFLVGTFASLLLATVAAGAVVAAG